MCGRYAVGTDPAELVAGLDVVLDARDEPARSVLRAPQVPPPGAPDWNMAPTKQAPVVLTRAPRQDPHAPGVRQLRLLTWGLVPPWSADERSGVRMINARAETLLTSRAYGPAARRRRCLVPADGWYEWQPSPVAGDERGRSRRQPFFVRRADDAPLLMAGVYELWRDPQGAPGDPTAWLATFAVVTTRAEPGLERIHERQPVVLDPQDVDVWLDPQVRDPEVVAGLLGPRAPGRFTAWPVGRAVGSSRAAGPGLLAPAPAEEPAGVVDPRTGEVLPG